MEIPVLTWEICFHSDWCFMCNCVQDLKIYPNNISGTIGKYCSRCDTIYTLNVQETFNQDHKVMLPDIFHLPNAKQLEDMSKKIMN